MTERNVHIIKRQVLDLEIPTRDGFHELREDVIRVYYQEVLPAIDEIFSSFVDADTVLRLDRLELDLGDLQPGRLRKQLPQMIGEALREALTRQVRTATSEEKASVRLVNRNTTDLELLIRFLETGHLGWQSGRISDGKVETLFYEQLDDPGAQLIAFLRKAALKPQVKKRIIAQFPEVIHERILRVLLTPATAAVLIREAEGMGALLPKKQSAFSERGAIAVPALKAKMLEAVLELVSTTSGHIVYEATFRPFLRKVAQEVNKGYAPFIREISTAINLDPETSAFRMPELSHWVALEQKRLVAPADSGEAVDPDISNSPSHKDTREAPLNKKEQDAEKPPSDKPSPESEATEATRQNRPANTSDQESRKQKALPKDEAEPEGESLRAEILKKESGRQRIPFKVETGTELYVGNAGLVLLWPFLPALFETLEWVESDEFVSEETQIRAAQLLHYLAFGDLETPESEMVLNKIMVGLDLETVIPLNPHFSEKELVEAEGLLTTVIHYWNGLGNVSPAGFRGSFLVREGILRKQDAAWKLQVETHALDLLMGKLPWSISIVKFKWLNEYIHVEW